MLPIGTKVSIRFTQDPSQLHRDCGRGDRGHGAQALSPGPDLSKAHERKELDPAIEEAAKFDRKIVIEEGVGGKKQKAREIECSVLGNDNPEASLPGEIVPGKEFYDYTAKYLDEGSELIIPAKLSKAETRKVQQLAISAFKAVDGRSGEHEVHLITRIGTLRRQAEVGWHRPSGDPSVYAVYEADRGRADRRHSPRCFVAHDRVPHSVHDGTRHRIGEKKRSAICGRVLKRAALPPISLLARELA